MGTTIAIIVMTVAWSYLSYSVGRYDGRWSERLRALGILMNIALEGTPTEKYNLLVAKIKLQKALEQEWNKE